MNPENKDILIIYPTPDGYEVHVMENKKIQDIFFVDGLMFEELKEAFEEPKETP
jgi:hypothetical protein